MEIPDIGTNWIYIDRGDYIFNMEHKDEISDLIRLSTVPVQLLSSEETVNMNSESIYAFEVPQIKNKFNKISIETNDYINQSTVYEYSILSKNFIGVSQFEDFISIGRQLSGELWYPWEYSNFTVYTDYPTIDWETPILLIRPHSTSTNVTRNENFATLTIKHEVPNEFSDMVNVYPFGWGRMKNLQTVSTTNTFQNFNPDFVSQFFNVPLSLEANQIYNVSLKSTNMTYSDNPMVTGRNLYNTYLFNLRNYFSENETLYMNFLIFAVDNIQNLLLNLNIYSPDALIEVKIDKVDSTILEFNSLEQNIPWNEDRDDGEVKNKEFLATQIVPDEMKAKSSPSFDYLLGFLSILVCSIFLRKKK